MFIVVSFYEICIARYIFFTTDFSQKISFAIRITGNSLERRAGIRLKGHLRMAFHSRGWWRTRNTGGRPRRHFSYGFTHGSDGSVTTGTPTCRHFIFAPIRRDYRNTDVQALHFRADQLQSQDPTDLPIFFCGYNLLKKSPAGNVSVSFCLLFFDSP